MIVKADEFESFEQVSCAMTFPEFSTLAVKYMERLLVPELAMSSVRLSAYLWLREVRKCDHRFATMLALQSAPKAMTDREYLEGRHNWVKDVSGDPGELMKIARRNAAAEGVSPPSDTAVYEPGLAEYPLDPKAFVTGGRNELRRKCEQRGLDCDGPVKVKAHRQKEVKAGRLGADLISNIAAERIKTDPDLPRRMSPRELVEDIRATHEYTDKSLYGQVEGRTPSAKTALKIPVKKPKAKRK
jgi:hypothetical protein